MVNETRNENWNPTELFHLVKIKHARRMNYSHFVLLFLLLSAVQSQERNTDDVSSFLWLSDIHLDPFYSHPQAVAFVNPLCAEESSNKTFPYGHVGCDSPPALLHETLRHAQQSIQDKGDIDFVVVTGDLCRHGNDMLKNPVTSTQNILMKVIEAIQVIAPDAHIIASVGNNDFTPDYYIDVEKRDNNTLLNMVTDAFQSIFISSAEESSFRSGAYLARNVSENLTVISLNTVMYSSNHAPEQTHIDDPLGQFEWLTNQLQLARATGRRVYIVGHVPPSIGSYRRAQQWHESYIIRYYEIIQDFFPDVIAAQLFGHLHTDEFRLVNPTSSSSKVNSYPLFMTSSITPIYGSNPSYRLVDYETATGQLLDYDTFYFDITKNASSPSWTHAPSFRQAYNVSDMSSESIESIVRRLSDDSDGSNKALWDAFLSRQNVHSSSSNDDDDENTCDDSYCHREWLCTITSITEKEYEDCVYVPWDTPATLPLLLIGAVATFAVVVTLFWRARRCLKRRHYLSHLQEIDIPETDVQEEEPQEQRNDSSSSSCQGIDGKPLPQIS
jgi:sphingomyelin phosphodiesterase acid-like 3